MIFIIFAMTFSSFLESKIIVDFNNKCDISNWKIVDDVVMGGKSSGKFGLDKYQKGVFKGKISLDNNGGFSSVRYRFNKISTIGHSKIVLKVKGDNKIYQFRVKSDIEAYYSYIFPFSTTGDWQTIEIPLNKMYPSFRGRKLNQPNFAHASIEEITFLIGNKMEEKFEFIIDKIELI